MVVREAQILTSEGFSYLPKVTLDTGASSGNYIGRKVIQRLPNIAVESCKHSVRLGDGKTQLNLTECVHLDLQLYTNCGTLTEPIYTSFFIVDTLGNEAIIGLPDLLGDYFEHLTAILEASTQTQLPRSALERVLTEFQRLFLDFEQELDTRFPNHTRLKGLVEQARRKGSTYRLSKQRIQDDINTRRVLTSDNNGGTVAYLWSPNYGACYEDDRIENVVQSMECLQDFPLAAPGELIYPWSKPAELCPEELETPDPLSFNEDILTFMELSVEDSRKEYYDLLTTHITPEMLDAIPETLELLKSRNALDTFAPAAWNGLKIPPATLTLKGDLPERLAPKTRPVRNELYSAAKQEYERLRTYFYVDSDSPIASPLVIAPKATAPYIRFCGDYRVVNKYITIPQQPIPIVQHALTKAARYKIYVDLDMANSFHQIPLSEEFSNILSVQTPWGLVRPKFLPEGVGPASGLLQHIVRDIFKDFEEWIIVIFDNFLICAEDYSDAYSKLQKVLDKCVQYGIVLKMKKSWIGVTTVNFFGFEVTHGRWKLSDSRKQAISNIPFPANAKEMQSFLGAALFFHHHIPDYSEWSAKLYAMTHTDFVWDPSGWQYDYLAHFNRFKDAITKAAELYFPDYSLPWVIRCDASQHAVGAVLFQIATTDVGQTVHQPIAFASRTFSKPASNWDTYKREAYALYYSVHTFNFYLRGKDFIIETDHRNLQWIESSQSPIVIRWRALLQSFSFQVRHIPGRENRVADWLSRASFDDASLPTLNTISSIDANTSSFEHIMRSVHSTRNLHFGASETWRRAKMQYPTAHISVEAVRRYVKECPLCQKLRDTGIKGLPAQYLTLKPSTYRRAVGIDHVSITPEDKHGNKCVILVVEHFSHFPQAYPVKDYTADTVAKVLFKHFCTFGMFDQLASDPGSSFTSDVIKQLNSWLGVQHKVSLVGRHESNGCEGSAKQFVRHLKSLVLEERLIDCWSDDMVLPLINFALASFPTSETGGLTPFQLKYGTQDAEYFKLPDTLNTASTCHEILRRLDDNLKIVREISFRTQTDISTQRLKATGQPAHYEEGDLILWNPKEKSSDHLETKLSPNWLGPYEVIKQIKNDIECFHINLKSKATFHVSRVKPFFGTREEALEVAKYDRNQYSIVSFNYFTGNPHVRQSLSFNVTFEDGTIDMPYSSDLADSSQFDQYVNTYQVLYQLRYITVQEAKSAASALRRTSITIIKPGDIVFLHLRYYDGRNAMWYDAIGFPEKHKQYVVESRVLRSCNKQCTRMELYLPLFDNKVIIDSYDATLYVINESDFDPDTMILVDTSYFQQYPKLID